MLKALTKTIIIALLLMLLGGQALHAQNKVYQSDSNMPFVKMMLSMMEAMGILDKLPANGRGGYGMPGYPSSPLSSLSSPYARALAMQGMSPGSSLFQNSYLQNSPLANPFTSSPWLQSPWSQSNWGSPSWGVLPTNSYSPYGYQGYNNQWSAPYWSSSDLTGWVNEPWETSEWNTRAKDPAPAATPVPAEPAVVPLVQNFNYSGSQPVTQKNAQNNARADTTTMNRPSPLSKYEARGQSTRRQSVRPPAPRSAPRSSQSKASPLRKKAYQKPCVTEFCGLKKPNLNGLWVAQNGEILGVKNKRYLWSDGDSRHLSGQFKIQNEYLVTSVDGHEKLMYFKYKHAGNHLVTMRPDGQIREFVRMPRNQYQNNYLSYGQGY